MRVLAYINFTVGARNHVVVDEVPVDRGDVRVHWKTDAGTSECTDIDIAASPYQDHPQAILLGFTMGAEPSGKQEGDTDQIEIIIDETTVTVPPL